MKKQSLPHLVKGQMGEAARHSRNGGGKKETPAVCKADSSPIPHGTGEPFLFISVAGDDGGQLTWRP